MLKLVMKLYSSTDLKPQSKADQSLTDAADDFYVFIYDEQEKGGFKQQQFKKKGKKSMAPDSVRVFGFWCFNAGLGFKKIQSLNPRSVLLTSGTLSPLPSFEAEL